MTFETINSISMADFKFKHSNGERLIRLEGRGIYAAHGANTWQIGGNLSPPTFQVGDTGASFAQPLGLVEATCSGPMTVGGVLSVAGLKINDLDIVSLDGNNNCALSRPCQFPSGFTSAGVCGFQGNVAMNAVQMSSLTTPSINIQMPGLASHIEVDSTARITFGQLSTTTIHGDLHVAGNLTSSSGGSVDLTPY